MLAATVRAEDCQKTAVFEQLEKQWNVAHQSGDLAALESVWADNMAIFIHGIPPLMKEDAVTMWETVPVRFEDYRSEILACGVRARLQSFMAGSTGPEMLEEKRWRNDGISPSSMSSETARGR
jgi:hypothetical protein